jgi:uncharacterized protein YbaA (DUF1428 family)
MKEPRFMPDAKSMPCDVKRMAWGGFKVSLDR